MHTIMTDGVEAHPQQGLDPWGKTERKGSPKFTEMPPFRSYR